MKNTNINTIKNIVANNKTVVLRDNVFNAPINITRINQNEPVCNALGGQYKNEYTYDVQKPLGQSCIALKQCLPIRFFFQYSPIGELLQTTDADGERVYKLTATNLLRILGGE